MSTWSEERTERVMFRTEIGDGRSVVLSNGAGVKVNSVMVRFERQPGAEWSKPWVSVAHGRGWDLTVTSVPRGLRHQTMPAWLASLVSEVQP